MLLRQPKGKKTKGTPSFHHHSVELFSPFVIFDPTIKDMKNREGVNCRLVTVETMAISTKTEVNLLSHEK